MKTRSTSSRHFVLLGAIALASGCQTLAPTEKMADFNQLYASGNYQAAADSALQSAGGLSTEKQPELLWSLQAGTALTASGQFALSNQVFDAAEDLAKEEDTEHLVRKGFEKLTSTLVNNNLNRYSPTVYDGVMVNTYKALNSMFLADAQSARIEFNRAADRQRRAEEHFRSKIQAQKEKLSQEQVKAEAPVPANGYQPNRAEAEQTVYQAYPELQEWQVYPDFVNPYTDYLHGLYFMLGSSDKDDLGKARDSLRRVAGMNPNNPAVKTDLQVVNNLIRGTWRKQKLNPAVWVIFENGLGPEIEELLVPIPLFLVNDKVEYSQLALPKLKLRDQAYSHLELFAGSKPLGKTEQLASLDRVVQTEFKKEFPYKVTEAVISTIAKGAIQYEARRQGGLAGALAAGVYQAATTRADKRIWSALPKEVQVARIRPPANRKLTIKSPGLAEPLEVELPDSQFSIIYIKASAPGSQPIYQIAGY
ncbi:COG3014 family protein [Stutzerimonas nitrititolerans]|uniref:COG3014 family protein n=1 Tax=Stutzerimonas nitrititolerans TaxID=2482751 RepID=UPI0028A75D6C|nr:hypothetical protein [Stutzerimonas nitrititolerans]